MPERRITFRAPEDMGAYLESRFTSMSDGVRTCVDFYRAHADVSDVPSDVGLPSMSDDLSDQWSDEESAPVSYESDASDVPRGWVLGACAVIVLIVGGMVFHWNRTRPV